MGIGKGVDDAVCARDRNRCILKTTGRRGTSDLISERRLETSRGKSQEQQNDPIKLPLFNVNRAFCIAGEMTKVLAVHATRRQSGALRLS